MFIKWLSSAEYKLYFQEAKSEVKSARIMIVFKFLLFAACKLFYKE